jgi:hypothetical protein
VVKKLVKNIEQFVGIDWSGAKGPKQSYSVSLASCSNEQACPTPITSKLSRSDVYAWIAKQIDYGVNSLIGIDCNLGYAHSVLEAQLGKGASYLQLWSEIETLCEGEPNFFAGPVWQSSPFSDAFWTSGTQPDWFNLHALRRITERKAVDQGFGNPESPFKLIGAKQVGKGGLAGMRVMHKLKQVYGDKVAIWPFEQHLVDSATVIISENFPRYFIRRAGFGNQKIRNISELNAILAFYDSDGFSEMLTLNDHLSDAIIASAGMRWLFAHENPLLIRSLPPQAIQCEGWIFGVKP